MQNRKSVPVLLALSLGVALGIAHPAQASDDGFTKTLFDLSRETRTASFEDIANLETRLNLIRNQIRHKRISRESWRTIVQVQRRLNELVGKLFVEVSRPKWVTSVKSKPAVKMVSLYSISPVEGPMPLPQPQPPSQK